MKSSSLRWLWPVLVLLALVPSLSIWVSAQSDDSPAPILISEPGSTRALVVPEGVKLMALDRFRSQAVIPGHSMVLFAANLQFMEGEGANALRVLVEDGDGHMYRFPVTDVRLFQGTPGPSAIYALTVDVNDTSKFWDLDAVDGDTLIGLTWRGMISNRTRLGINHVGGSIPDDAGSAPTPLNAVQVLVAQRARLAARTEAQDKFSGNRRRLLEQATFGPTDAMENRIKQIGIKNWISEQFNMPYPSAGNPFPSDPLKSPAGTDQTCDNDNTVVPDNPATCFRDSYTMYKPQTWFTKEALYSDAQLRHRVAWALAQIWVTSGVDISQGRHMVEYYKILSNNAFGNYKNLMKEMTLNPTMGDYLSMSLSTRNSPNENYAREIMQLFTIGLFMLNQDGTYQLDGSGNPIPTYTQDGVNNLTKVFTGWTFCNPTNPVQAGCANYVSTTVPDYIDPMILNAGVTTTNINNNRHDLTSKTLLDYPGVSNKVVPACPTTGPTACAVTTGVTTAQAFANVQAYANSSLDQAIDNIFFHPNVAPFVSKILIQHLVTSDPSPAYVSRVAAVFNNNGANVKGDMKSVIRAILLDPEARGNVKTDPGYGKLREPFQLLTNFGREFGARSADGSTQTDGWVTGGSGVYNNMAEVPFMSPTVFNFFPPGYVIPGTANVGPEFAIMNTGTTIARANFFNTMVFSTTPIAVSNPNFPNGLSFDYSDLQALAQADPTGNTMADELNRRMLHGTMTAQMKTTILNSLGRITNDANGLAKMRQAVYLVATSSQYQVQR